MKRTLVTVKKWSAVKETICVATTIGFIYCTSGRISTTSAAQHDPDGNKKNNGDSFEEDNKVEYDIEKKYLEKFLWKETKRKSHILVLSM
jgi:hypothetical protein